MGTPSSSACDSGATDWTAMRVPPRTSSTVMPSAPGPKVKACIPLLLLLPLLLPPPRPAAAAAAGAAAGRSV